MRKAVTQGLVGFILGAIVSAILLASEPQWVGDVQSGLHDLRLGARRLVADNDRTASTERRYGDGRDNRDYRDERDRRDDHRDRYDSERSPSSDSRSRDSGDNSSPQ